MNRVIPAASIAAPSAEHRVCGAIEKSTFWLHAMLREARLGTAAQELNAQQQPLDSLPDARVSTVTPASRRLLDRIGAWPHCWPGAAAFSDMQARTRSARPTDRTVRLEDVGLCSALQRPDSLLSA